MYLEDFNNHEEYKCEMNEDKILCTICSHLLLLLERDFPSPSRYSAILDSKDPRLPPSKYAAARILAIRIQPARHYLYTRTYIMKRFYLSFFFFFFS